MNIMSIAGLGIAMAVCALAVMMNPNTDSSSIMRLISYQSLIIVLGGTIASIVISYSGQNLLRLIKTCAGIFVARPSSPTRDLATIMDVADIARRDDLHEVERILDSIKNDMLREGMQLLVVDQVDRDTVIEILMTEIENREQRRDFDAKMLKKIADLTPAWGMIGTLFGLVILLGGIDQGSKFIGQAMATAIMTTLYGAILSNILFLPLHNKTIEIKEEERTLNEMVRDGILMIGTRQRPELMEKELIKYLDSKSVERYKALKATAEATNQRMVI